MWNLLKNRDFFRLWLATGLWWQAMWTEQLVLGWMVLELTDSAWWVALIGFYRSIPLLFIGPFSAAVTDRFRRRTLILVLQSINAFGLGVLAALFWMEILQYWHIALVALSNGACWALDWPTRRSLVPDLVGKERVVDAMMLENVLSSLTRVSGPLGAGALLAGVGILGSLLALGGMGVLALLILVGMKTRARAPGAPRGALESWHSAREGMRYIRRQKSMLGVVLITVTMNLWAFPYQTLLPVFARDVLGKGALSLGFLGAGHGLGTLVGVLLVKGLHHSRSNEWLFAGGSLLSCAGLAAFSLSTSFGISVGLLMVAGLGQAGFSVMQSSIILSQASDEMRGRAMGALVLAIGLGPLGRLQSGAMAAAWGAPLAVGSMALGAGLATLGVALLLPGFIGLGNPTETRTVEEEEGSLRWEDE